MGGYKYYRRLYNDSYEDPLTGSRLSTTVVSKGIIKTPFSPPCRQDIRVGPLVENLAWHSAWARRRHPSPQRHGWSPPRAAPEREKAPSPWLSFGLTSAQTCHVGVVHFLVNGVFKLRTTQNLKLHCVAQSWV